MICTLVLDKLGGHPLEKTFPDPARSHQQPELTKLTKQQTGSRLLRGLQPILASAAKVL